MTDQDQRRQDIIDELRRGDEALRAAEALMAAELHADAVSRAYYGAWHHLRAVLLSRGVEARTHAGAIHLFNTEMVKKGTMSSSNNRILGGLQRAREMADYDSAVQFSADDARVLTADARSFAEEVKRLLTAEGWVSNQVPAG